MWSVKSAEASLGRQACDTSTRSAPPARTHVSPPRPSDCPQHAGERSLASNTTRLQSIQRYQSASCNLFGSGHYLLNGAHIGVFIEHRPSQHIFARPKQDQDHSVSTARCHTSTTFAPSAEQMSQPGTLLSAQLKLHRQVSIHPGARTREISAFHVSCLQNMLESYMSFSPILFSVEDSKLLGYGVRICVELMVSGLFEP